MSVYLALSCLQGLPAKRAVSELMELEPDGIQLTPGNFTGPGFKEWFLDQGIPYMLHEGFDWVKRRRDVWSQDGKCTALDGASVHSPKGYWDYKDLKALDRVLEVMYPHKHHHYSIQDLEDVLMCVHYEIPMAVDISHLDITCYSHPIDDVLDELDNYGGMREIHVSQAKVDRDAHLPLTDKTPYLDWALKHVDTLPIVLECYMHKLDPYQRKEQIKKVKNG